MEEATTHAWRERWKDQDAWTAGELAMLCCGWDPSTSEHPDQKLYNDVLETIIRAVRVNVLPTLAVRWEGTVAEQSYAGAPLRSQGSI